MNIGIDARFFGSIGKGLGRYTQKLVEYLEETDSKNQYFIFLRKENFDDYKPHNKNFQKVLADYAWYSFSEQFLFPKLLLKHKLDLMHFPHFNVPIFYRQKFVLTIHDLILIHFPTIRGTTLSPLKYWVKYLAYKFVIKSAIKRARKIFAVSNFTKKDIVSTYPWAENKICVTYEACENSCKISPKAPNFILEKYGIIKPYLLYVGNAYPHKNLETLIEAFEQVLGVIPDIQLILVGKDDFFYARLRKFVKEKNVQNIHFPGFVTDRDLDFLYRFAAAYVFPSLYEGFGLPPLEAMAKGAPVVSSNHECMKEVLGDAALYVDAKNAKNLTKGLLEVLNSSDLRQNLIQKGYEQIKKYSWEKMTRETLEAYLDVI